MNNIHMYIVQPTQVT